MTTDSTPQPPEDAKRVIFFDTTLRDGEQSPGIHLNTREKVEIAQQLKRLGVDVVEAGFPITSPGDFEGVQAIAREVPGIVVAALARANEKDVQVAGEAVRDAGHGRIHTFIATSDIHLKHKLRMEREQVFAAAVDAVRLARSLCDDVEFSCEDATRSDVAFVAEVVAGAIAEGATTINIPDTVGYTMPNEFQRFLLELYERCPTLSDVTLSVHCHNDLGLAVANSLAGLHVGARQVEGCVNGIGERAGNASLEELAMVLRTRAEDLGGLWCGIETTEITRSSRLVSRLTGYPVQPNKAVVGRNAFAHEAGIHQHGVLSNPLTYEIMDAQSVGLAQSSIVLGKHSGRHALQHALEELGYELDREQLNATFVRFKDVADKKGRLSAMDLEALMSDEMRVEAETGFHLDEMCVLGRDRAGADGAGRDRGPGRRAPRGRGGRRRAGGRADEGHRRGGRHRGTADGVRRVRRDQREGRAGRGARRVRDRGADRGGTVGVDGRARGERDRLRARGEREPPGRARRARRGGWRLMGRTLFEKVWADHEVAPADARGPAILYVDLHMVHEVTSPQAFDGLRLAGRRVRRPDRTMATVDHNVPTIGRERGIEDPLSAAQIAALERNCAEFGLPLFSLRSARQGIVHVIGPELGLTQPGMTIVCGDSHTSTHGAFGALAFGIGTSEVEHVLATQTLPQAWPKTMRISIDGTPGLGVSRQGPDPRHDRPDRRLRRRRPRGRVRRLGHPRPLDGGADDGLQHVDRGRRPRRDDRPRRHHLRLPRGPPRGAGRLRRRRGALAGPAERRRRGLRLRGAGRRRRAGAAGHLGHHAGHGRAGHRPRADAGRLRRPGRARRDPPRARVHGPARRRGDRGHRPRRGLPRLVHQRPHRGPARRRRRGGRPARGADGPGDGRARARCR